MKKLIYFFSVAALVYSCEKEDSPNLKSVTTNTVTNTPHHYILDSVEKVLVSKWILVKDYRTDHVGSSITVIDYTKGPDAFKYFLQLDSTQLTWPGQDTTRNRDGIDAVKSWSSPKIIFWNSELSNGQLIVAGMKVRKCINDSLVTFKEDTNYWHTYYFIKQ